jgi:subfamily B ATP-binding cassette protein MsbA
MTLRLGAPPRLTAAAIVILGLAAAALEAIGLSLFMPLVQRLAGGAPGPGAFARFLAATASHLSPAALVVLLCLSLAAKNAVGFAGGYLARRLDGLVAHRLRVKVLSRAFSAGVDLRPDARMTDVVTTLATHTWKVSEALSLVWRLAVCGITAVVFLGLMLLISARLTALALGMLTATALVVHFATSRAEAVGREVVEENKRFGLRMWESAGALQLIRSFGREAYELDRFGAVSDRIRRRILRLDLLWATPAPIAEIMGVGLIGGLIVCAQPLRVGLSAMAAFLAVLYRLQGPIRELLSCKVALEGLSPALADVDDFLAHTKDPYLLSGSVTPPPLGEAITFRNVSFRYPDTTALALDGVTVSFRARQTTAVVGRSGAGKSTLMALLLRFRDPTAGEVFVDGRPLRDLDLAAWRARLSFMPQEAQLFNATVAENIAYGDLSAGRERICAAAEVAGAAEFIEALPHGYETDVGDRGVRLSGGQRQRIALARTILRDPEILLLVEPTNALDVETERAFQAALQRFSAGRTVIVIAHRLSTVEGADQVVVLENGRVAETGAPRDLLARPGRFAQLHGLDAHGRREVA